MLNRETSVQIRLIEDLLTQYDTENDEQKREKLLAGVAVVGAYIKRFGNILLTVSLPIEPEKKNRRCRYDKGACG